MTTSRFPPVEDALEEPNGLLAQGGELTSDMLIDAYAHGIFPWPSAGQDDDALALLWWSPEPRAVIFPEHFHASRSLKKSIRQTHYSLSLNRHFEEVIHRCAKIPRADEDAASGGTWITDDIINAYITLHKAGFAHSIEVWDNDALVGGLYGVAVGKLFCGESMFHEKTDASKIAMFALCLHLQKMRWPLVDCQIQNPHLESMGATTISRERFKAYLPKLQAGWQNVPEALKPTGAFSQDLWTFDNAVDLLNHEQTRHNL